MQKEKTQTEEDVYRPIIIESDIAKKIRFRTNSKHEITLVPYTIIPHTVVDNGSADPNVFRSSFLVLPERSMSLTNTGIPFGAIISPLSTSCEITQYEGDANIGQIQKCRCTAYYSPSSYAKNDRLYCQFCRSAGPNLNQVSKSLLSKGLIHQTLCSQPTPIYYIVLFQVSRQTVEQNILTTLFQALQASCNAIGDQHIKFVFIGHTAKQLRIFSLQANELKVNIVRDLDEIPFTLAQISYSAAQSARISNHLKCHVEDMGYLFVEPQFNNLPEILELLIKLEQKALKKIMVLSTKGEHSGNYNTGAAAAKQPRKNNQNPLLWCAEDSKFKNLSSLTDGLQGVTTMDLFLFCTKQMHLQDLKIPFLLSGGCINSYTNKAELTEFYYEVFRVVTRLTGFKVTISCKTSPGIKVQGFSLGHYFKNKSSISINSLTQDQTLSLFLSYNQKQFQGNKGSLQIIVDYLTGEGSHRRIINSVVYKSNASQVYQTFAGFDPEASIRLIATQIAIRKHQIRSCRQTLPRLKSIIKKFRQFFLVAKDMFEEASKKKPQLLNLWNRLDQNFCLFFTQMFYLLYRYYPVCLPTGAECWQITLSQQWLLNNPVVLTSKKMYPRVYSFDMQDLQGNSPQEYLMSTIACSSQQLQKQTIYLFDCGNKLVMLLKDIQGDTLEELFGTRTISQLQQLKFIEQITQKSTVLCKLVERIRSQSRGGCKSLQIIVCNQTLQEVECQIFIQDNFYTDNSDNYELFMKKYTSYDQLLD